MTAKAFSATVKADGTCLINISPDKSGIQWTVGQTGVESVPTRATGTVTTRLNGNYLTSTATMPASAGGQPAINMQATDTLSFLFTGLTVGDNAIVTLYYTETPWGTIPKVDVV